MTTEPSRIGLVEGAGGNIASVRGALRRIGVIPRPVLTGDDLAACTAIVLPGVGAFPAVMRRLNERGLAEAIRLRVADGLYVLGICAGMQVLADEGDEFGPSPGLGLIPGRVQRLRAGDGLRLPHMGWNEVESQPASRLMPAAQKGSFYFVHSYAFHPADFADATGFCNHGERFVAAVERGRVFGVQFHPEKSQRDGLLLLRRFVRAVDGGEEAGELAPQPPLRAGSPEAQRC